MNWFRRFKKADYENHHYDRVNEIDRTMNFKSWFQDGDRIYVPFTPPVDDSSMQPNEEVVGLLENNGLMS